MIATPGELGDRVPLAVLVNAGSASAAEVLAGALQDHGRALLVGEPTFGKAHVQTVIPLASGHGLKLTTSRYFTPSGRSLAGHGLIPDVIVGDEQALERAQALLEELAERKTLTREIHAWN
jgi:carboxyl-terminal processing protease